MDKELQKKKPEQKQRDASLSTVLISSLAIVILFLVELFLMIEMPQMLSAITGVGVAIAGCVYLDLYTYIKRLQKKEREQEEQYASILKSEKAAYLLIRKYFDEIEEQLTLMEDKFTDPFQEVIAAQKATAKVVINRNKEHTDAMMNSNDKMYEAFLSFKTKLDDRFEAIPNVFEERIKDQNAALLQKQTEISNQMRELELSLRNEILQAVNKMSSVSPQVVMAPPQMMQMQQSAAAPVNMEPEPFTGSDDLGELGSLGDLPDFMPLDVAEEKIPEPEPELSPIGQPEPEPIAESEPEPELELIPESESEPELEPIAESEPEPMPEAIPEPVKEEAPPMPDLSDPNKMMSPDDINALLASMAADTASASSLPDVEVTEESEPEPMPEAVPEPVAEEAPPMPDLSDPNKMMSPDDISALLASMSADATSAASLPDIEVEEEPEPEPIPEPEPVAEAVPPMPDLSDPNHKMSPDEIAALFANLG